MVQLITFIMLVAGGLFAGGVLTVAWNRLPAWKHQPFAQFKPDFNKTIQVADTLQPILLVITIVTGIIFSLHADGTIQILTLAASAAYSGVLIASLAVLVPLQRRILSAQSESGAIKAMRDKWHSGHLGRTVLSTLAFALSAGAVALSIAG